jgi:DNA-binding Lrp family transcriptional regulator
MSERKVLNEFQRDFPLVPMPYAALACALGRPEPWVLATLRRLIDDGLVSRVGVIFRPGSVGASTLAAIAVPPSRLASVARSVSAHAGVNHNYEREHRFNLWFVANAAGRAELAGLLARIERETVLPVLAMPLVTEYHIDLGFDLDNGRPSAPLAAATAKGASPALDATQRRVVAALQEGLPLSSRPYAEIAERAGCRAAKARRACWRSCARGATRASSSGSASSSVTARSGSSPMRWRYGISRTRIRMPPGARSRSRQASRCAIAARGRCPRGLTTCIA